MLHKLYRKIRSFFVRNAPTLTGAQVAIGTGVSTATVMALATAGNVPLAMAVGTWSAFCVVTSGITIAQAVTTTT